MNFAAEALKQENYIIEIRRYFHKHPELSFKEYETTEKIAEELKKMDIEPHFYDGLTGCYAIIGNKNGKTSQKTVALRADIDALPVEEKTDLPYKSCVQGVMHACGHDCHAAMLLGAAKLLKKHEKELNGRVKLIFQAAEESCHGAESYIKRGILNDVDVIYGTHVWAHLDAPYMNFEPGYRMAGCDNFSLDVYGKSAHGSMPQQGADAIVSAAAIIMNIQTLVSRKNDARSPLVITVGQIEGGQNFNIIANKVTLKGTVRTCDAQTRQSVEEWIRETAENTAAVFKTTAKLTYQYFAPPLYNDDRLAGLAQNAAVKLYGNEVLRPVQATMGSEDFSYFSEKIPAVYGYLGIRNEKSGAVYPHHSDLFLADEGVLHRGAAMYAQFAWDYLNQNTI